MKPVRDAEHILIYKDEYAYCAHPFVCRLAAGDWLVVFNEGMRRKYRLHPPNDPRFHNVMARSTDGGRTWSPPQVVPGYDWYGVECSALTELAGGDLVLNQWQFRWHSLDTARQLAEREPIWFPPWGLAADPASEVLEGERAERARRAAELYPWARANGAAYVHISPDGGHTWPETIEIDTTPYPGGYGINGGLQLPNGEFLLPLTVIPGWDFVFIVRSADGGRTWSQPLEAARMPGRHLTEASLVQAPSGRLVMMMRNDRGSYLVQCVSDDEGYNWHSHRELSVWGYPPHLLLLPDGRLLCVYGHRRQPFSIRAIVSDDEGESWDAEDILVIRDNLPNDDLGYPTSILTEDGRVFTTYYAQDVDGVTCIQGTYYRL